MKFLILSIFLFQLVACGGGVDNSEPPAALVDFTQTARLSSIKEIDYGAVPDLYARSEPLVLDKIVVIAGTDGLVTVFNKDNFSIAWQKTLPAVQVAAVGGNEKVLLLGTRGGEVVALNAETGEQFWNVRVSSEVLARPVISSGIVVVKTVDGQMTALDEKTGQEKWIFKKDIPPLSVRGNSVPLIVDEKIITGLDNGKLVIIDLISGRLFWEKTITIPRGRSETERLVDLDADLIINDSVIYIAGFQGRVVALDLKTGDFLWVKKMSVIRNMIIDNDRLYITDDRSHIWSVDVTTGATIWKQSVFTARKLTSAALMHDFLVFGDYQGYVHVLAKADGHQVARLQLDNAGINTAPVVINDNIYIHSRNSIIHQLQLKKSAK